MTLSEIIIKEIEEVYLNDGFHYVKSKKTFKKKDGKNELIIRYQFFNGLNMQCTYGIMLSAVEELKKKAWGKLYIKDYSILNDRAYLPGNIDAESSFLLIDDNDKISEQHLIDAIDYEKKMYSEFGRGFFSKYQDLKVIDQFLNGAKIKDNSFSSLAKSTDRYFALSVISAAIVQNPDRFHIYQKQREYVASGEQSAHYGLLEKYVDPLINTLKETYN